MNSIFHIQIRLAQVIDKNKLRMKSGKNPKLLQRLMDEITILKSVRHPNIVRVHKVYENGNKVFIVMELMKGGELFDHIIDRGLLSAFSLLPVATLHIFLFLLPFTIITQCWYDGADAATAHIDVTCYSQNCQAALMKQKR